MRGNYEADEIFSVLEVILNVLVDLILILMFLLDRLLEVIMGLRESRFL